MQVLHDGTVLSEEVEAAKVSFAEERTPVAVSWQLKGDPGRRNGPGEARGKCRKWQ